MNEIKNLAIFCGSSKGNNNKYSESAIKVGNFIANNNMNLIYGGGNIGLMGIVASTASKKGAKVIGVLPEILNLPQVVNKCVETERIITEDMHSRKKAMYDRSDAFIAMPGGIGTFEEFFEAYTWLQLNIHIKPVGLLNIDDFYTPLYDFLINACNKGFISKKVLNSLCIDSEIDILINKMREKELDLPLKV